MRTRVHTALVAVALAGPFVLAFFAGGYFDEPRLWAGLGACALLAAAAIVSPRPLPASAPGRIALAGLALLAVWTAVSIAWAPLSTRAVADADRLLLYVAAFAAALALFESRPAIRAVEPVLAAGALVVVGYGLSERFFPGVFHIPHDASAFGRLSRPLTYWNAMGAIAAIGLVLSIRVASDATRARALRLAATVAAAPLGLGLYLTFSRGALVAFAVGLVLLAVLDRRPAQLRSMAVALAAAALTAFVGVASSAVRDLSGTLAQRERSGVIAFALLVLIAGGAAVAQLVLMRRETSSPVAPFASRRTLAAVLAAVMVGGFAVAAVTSERKPGAPPTGATTSRLTSIQSNRSDYWRVALDEFGDHPLKGGGSGSFAVAWLQKRTVRESVLDAHSLYLETAAELGVVGVALLTLFLGGVGWGAGRGYARDPVAAAGLAAALAVWLVHAGLDWLWEMPAVTLPILVVAASLVRLGEPYPPTVGATSRMRAPTAAAARVS